MRRAMARAEAGKVLDVAESTVLLGARDADLDRLLYVAGRVRDQGLEDADRPGVVTYSRKVAGGQQRRHAVRASAGHGGAGAAAQPAAV